MKINSYLKQIAESKEETDRGSVIDFSKKMFGFDDGEMEVSKFAQLFRKYQKELGFSKNIIQSFENTIETKIFPTVKAYKYKDSQTTESYFSKVWLEKPELYPYQVLSTTTETYSGMLMGHLHTVNSFNPSKFSTSKDIELGRIPIMKGSKYCLLNGMTDDEKLAVGEDPTDPQGYFIVKGGEQIIVNKEKLSKSQILIVKLDAKTGIRARMTCTGAKSTIIELTEEYKNPGNIVVKLDYLNDNRVYVLIVLLSLFRIIESHNSKKVVKLTKTEPRQVSDDEAFKFIMEIILSFVQEGEQRDKCYHILTPSVYKSRKELRSTSYLEYMNLAKQKSADSINARRTALSEITFAQSKSKFEELEENMGDYVFSNIEVDPKNPVSAFEMKFIFLCKMVSQLVRVFAGTRKTDDQDSWTNKRVESSGKEFELHFNQKFPHIMDSILKRKTTNVNSNSLTDSFNRFFTHAATKRGKENSSKGPMVEHLRRETPLAIYSQINKLNSNAPKKSRATQLRQITTTQTGYVCIGETPEGVTCGLNKNLSSSCWLSIDKDEETLVQNIRSNHMFDKNFVSEFINNEIIANMYEYIPILVNGRIYKWTTEKDYIFAYNDLKQIKQTPEFFDVCVNYKILDRHIEIFSDGGNVTRPLFVVDPLTHTLVVDKIENFQNKTIMELVSLGAIEFLHAKEQEQINILIAVQPTLVNEVNEFRKLSIDNQVYHPNYNRLKIYGDTSNFTHAEIDPLSLFGISGCTIPRASCMQGPRFSYQCSMGKQATSSFHLQYGYRFDTTFKRLAYASRSLFETLLMDTVGLTVMPSGETPIVAFMAFPENNEDGIVIKKEYLDHNFILCKYHSEKIEISGGNTNEKIELPRNLTEKKRARFHGIKEDGLPRIGAYLSRNDAILGKTKLKANSTESEDASVYVTIGHDGFVDRVQLVKKSDGSTTVKIRLIQIRKQIAGDKFASRYAQKGTCTIIKPESDLPRIVGGPNDGLVPDFFINPHSIPKRMTVNKIHEMLITKAILYSGERYNATTFLNLDLDKYKQILEDNGMDRDGNETMEWPNGSQIERVFVGACTYQALKHHVLDKFQQRSTGKTHDLTHQPVQGRVFEGGLRVGEMERDAMLSHGATSLILDRFVDCSDKFKIVICSKCSNIATSNFLTKNECRICNTDENLGFVEIPYIFLLIIRMLNTMNINVSLNVK